MRGPLPLLGTPVESFIMAPNRHANGSRLNPRISDAQFMRLLGIGVILAGLLFAYSSALTPFTERVRFQYEVASDGEKIPLTYVTCPSPWSLVVQDARPSGVISAGLCLPPARGHMTQAALVLLFVPAVGAWIMTRNPKRRPMPELPKEILELRKR
jgi:hypothetical protein